MRSIAWLELFLCGNLTSSASLSSGTDHGITVNTTESSVNRSTPSVISDWQHCLLKNVSSISTSNCSPPSLFFQRKTKKLINSVDLTSQCRHEKQMAAIQVTKRLSQSYKNGKKKKNRPKMNSVIQVYRRC